MDLTNIKRLTSQIQYIIYCYDNNEIVNINKIIRSYILTKTEKLRRALARGKNVPSERLKKVTKLANLSSTIHRLRENGVRIYTNKRQGQVFYRMVA